MATGLYIAMDFKPSDGSGIAEHTHQMAKHLTQFGENISVITRARPGDTEFDKSCGYPVTRIGIGSHTSMTLMSRLRRNIVVIQTILKTALRFKPDYLILDRWDYVTGLSAVILSIFGGIPFFLFAHRAEFVEGARWKSLRKITARYATKVICVSNHTRSYVLADGVEPDSTIVIYNGFDLEEIHTYRDRKYEGRFPRIELAFPNGIPTILSVSRLIKWKRIDRMIDAMPRVIQEIPDAHYVIVGSGDQEQPLKNLAKNSVARDSITFMGPLTGDEKFECFDRCDVFALPSDGEGFAVVFMEAMGFEKPIIGGCAGGTPEAITHGENGLLVDPNNASGIADAIIKILKNRDEAHRMGKNGRLRVERELNWRNSADKLLSIIHDTLGNQEHNRI